MKRNRSRASTRLVGYVALCGGTLWLASTACSSSNGSQGDEPREAVDGGGSSGSDAGGTSSSGASTGSSSGITGGSGGDAGSSSGVPSCPSGSTACDQCQASSCCAEEQACLNDSACKILLTCINLCAGDATCINACSTSTGTTAVSELVSALDCIELHCNAACNGDAGACGSTPTLHPAAGGTIYCGSTSTGTLSCSTGQECCLGGAIGGGSYAPNECASQGSTCTNGGDPAAGGTSGIPIECMQPADCAANGKAGAMACCIQSATTPVDAPGCTYPRATLGAAVVCEPGACGQNDVALCSSDADCTGGMKCTPGKWKTFQVGFCL